MNPIDEYKDFVASRTKDLTTSQSNLIHMAMGISGESGEMLDIVKKHFAYDKPLNILELVEELGDIVFYIQGMLNVLDQPYAQDISDLMRINTYKLTARYPAGHYTDKDALERKDKNRS